MAEQQRMHMPGVFGGLMRYDDEYQSKFMLSPTAIVAFLIAIIVFVLVLKIMFPISEGVISSGGVPAGGGQGGFFWSLLKAGGL